MISTKTCTKCGISKPIDEFYKQSATIDGKQTYCKVCKKEYDKKYRVPKPREEIKMTGYRPRSKYRNCAPKFGVFIAERLCKHIFKNLNIKADSVFNLIYCGNKKIYVKTASITLNNNKQPKWSFVLNRNNDVDYLLCIALDNQIDLNVLYMWMIPGMVINQKRTISISSSSIYKWNGWKVDIKDAQLCCAEMKKEK